ncbi:nonstructural protein [robinz microvirus RP_94]|nr:nonstructural protein [robinz microvirus RP_94]
MFDSAIESYSPVFSVPALGIAIRSFMDACSDKSSDVGRHPESFKLFHVGDFNELDGSIVSIVPHCICIGSIPS